MRVIKDTKARSLIKGISWRIFGTIDTFIISYIILEDFYMAAPIAILELFTKIILFYFHERIWNSIPWAREDKSKSHIRSFIKGISYRLIGTIDTILISWVLSGKPLSSLHIGFTEVITKLALFYIHERIWRGIRWGRKYFTVDSVNN